MAHSTITGQVALLANTATTDTGHKKGVKTDFNGGLIMPRKKSGTFDQSKYVQQFMHDKVTVKKVSFNRENDADLLEWLKGMKFSTYVKELIRLDMNEPSLSCHIVANRIKSCHDCNDCGRSPCEYMPDPGETTRINCPLWEARK